MEGATATGPDGPTGGAGDKGLKKDAIGFTEGLVIVLASTGFACAFYYRHELRKSVKNLLFIGVAPVIGATLLAFLFVKALIDYSDPAASYTGSSWFGVAPPAVIGVGFILLGFVLLFAWRAHQREPFFLRRREAAVPRVLEGKIAPEPAIAGGAE